jgi:glycosyltransferase involved in cell wall biosynthesis
VRNVLLVTYSYPPVERSGARRPAALAKYLPRFGWRPLVLAPKIDGGSARDSEWIIETDYRDVLADWKARLHLDRRRGLHEQFRLTLSKQAGTDKPHTLAIAVLKNLLTYPDVTKGWIPYALEAIESLRRQNQKIDAMITTFPPASSHLIGAKAKRILGCPWIADFRDLWTQDITTMRPRDLQFLQVRLEKRTLRRADMLVAVSDPWADRLRLRYRSHEVVSIPNGFDPDDFSPRPELTQKFTITYAGVLYQGQRDPTVLFAALRELIQDKVIPLEDVRVRFYAPPEPWLAPLVQSYQLEPVVELNGLIPRKEVLQREMESQLLLLLSWTNPKDNGLHTGKLFEYLGARRPILAIGGNRGAMTQVLDETRAGMHLSSKEEVRSFLTCTYGEFKRGGEVVHRGDASAISRYSHVEMSRSFANTLDRLTGVPRARREAENTPEMAQQ